MQSKGKVVPGRAKQSKSKERKIEMLRRTFLKMAGLAGIPLKEKPAVQHNPPHNSLQMPRLNRMPERVYAEEWKERNKRNPVTNHGFTYLEWILCPSGVMYPPPVSERDAEVAASVIQWLGTCCGLALMLECEAKIKKKKKKMVRKYHYWKQTDDVKKEN